MKRVQDQAKFEIERADKEREMAAAATIEIEMQKVRERESKVDQQLETIAEMRKVREEQELAERSEQLQQQQRAETQIAELKQELKKQKERLQDSADRNLASTNASPGKRDHTVKSKATICSTPLGYGGFFAMKQLAVNKAKDARPEVPFSGGTSIEYALHMNAFDAATDSEALDAKDKLFELTK